MSQDQTGGIRKRMKYRHHLNIALAFFLSVLLNACSDAVDDSAPPSTPEPDPKYAVGGTVSGLVGTGLVLQNNDGNDLSIDADGPFAFSSTLLDASAYNVTVLTQPSTPSQGCSITNASGTIAGATVTNIDVVCITNAFTLGGNVTNLAGTGLQVQVNGTDTYDISTASFTLGALADGTDYSVVLITQPSNLSQICILDSTTASGTIDASPVTDLDITCTTNPFTIGAAYLG